MRILFFLSILLLTNIASVFSKQNYGSLMYEIISPNNQDTSFIFGTMHMVPKDEFFVWDAVIESVEKCDKIAIETDLSMDRERQMELMKKMMLPEDSALENYIDTTKLNEFKAYVNEHVDLPKGTDEFIWRLKPFYSLSFILNYYLVDPASYDMYFAEMAKKSNKELISLESLDFQLSLVDKISIQEQFNLFVNTRIFEDFDRTYDAYSKMNMHLLEKIIREDKSYDQVEEWLVVKRNVKWIETIVPIIKKNSVFIAVGAGHLIGEKGLLKLFEDNGFTIQAVPLAVNDI